MKIFVYLFIVSGAMTLLYYMGFHDMPTGDLLSTIITEGLSGIKDASIYTELTGVLGLVAVVGSIVATLFNRQPDFTLLKAGFVLFFLGAFVIDLVWMYEKLFSYGTWYPMVASLIFIPFTYGFIVSAIDWVSGTD